MKWKLHSLEAARWLTVALAVVLLFAMLGQTPRADIPPQTVEDALLEQFALTDVEKADGQMLRRLYALNMSDYESVTLYYPATNMGARELLFIKLSDESQSEAVQAAIERRLETQKESFDGYGVEQTALLNDHSVIEARGVYVLFVVSQNAQAVRQAFFDAL